MEAEPATASTVTIEIFSVGASRYTTTFRSTCRPPPPNSSAPNSRSSSPPMNLSVRIRPVKSLVIEA